VTAWPARGGTSAAGGSSGSYAAISRSASSTAYTVSTERTTMLRNGLPQVSPRPAARAASRASGDSQRELSAYLAGGPVR
jgi:hypothetical protein